MSADISPRKVLVQILRDHITLSDFAKYDGETVRCKRLKMQFCPPKDYRPRITYFKGKPYLTFTFNDYGDTLDFDLSGKQKRVNIEERKQDPRLIDAIVGANLFRQIFRKVAGIDMASLLTGLGLGTLLLTIIIFFILPAMGIPVSIGKTPVVVTVQGGGTPQVPPGNFTLP